MTRDESRAVGFLSVLLLLATVARLLNRPEPVTITAAPLDVVALQEAGRKLAKQAPPPKARQSVRQSQSKPVPVIVDPGPLDLNRASFEEIDRLPGIGPAVALRIIARRDSVRRFRKLEDIDSVRGIGPALIEKIRPHVVVR